MRDCPACREQIPDDSRFCDQCGFRLSPIPVEALQERSKTTPPLHEDDAIPLTQVKTSSARLPGPALVEGTAPSAPVPLLVPPRPARDASPVRSDVSAAQEAAKLAPGGERVADANTRKCRRFPLKVEVSYNSEHNFFTGFMQNLSEGGLFVATHLPARLGEAIEVSFSVPGLGRVCTAVCRVRWIREYNPDATDSAPGMGLQFSQLDSDVRAAIELFVGHREPIFYDD